MEWIIGLAAGAIGGNVAGGLIGKINQGTLINSIAGIVGGGLGASLIGGSGGMDLMGIISQVIGGGVGGGIVLAIVSVVRQLIGK